MKHFAERLRREGMSMLESERKADLFARCGNTLQGKESLAFFVPGRIEVLGKHTDYAGGRSLLCALERGIAVVATPRTDRVIRVTDATSGETRELALDAATEARRGDWSNYVAAVARSLARNFAGATRGADIAFASDLPASSGMSSSSALVIGMFLVLDAVNDLHNDETFRSVITSKETLGNYLGAVENGRSFGPLAGDLGVGTLGGSQDQTAILCCRAGMLSQYSFCPVRAEGDVSLPEDRAFVVAFSGVGASKTSNALHQYNEASLAVTEILTLWNEAMARHDGCLADATGTNAECAERIRAMIRASRSAEFTPHRLLERFEQFVEESYDIIPQVSNAFARRDLVAVGELVDRSQYNVETLLGNQIPETIALAQTARELGADAASAFGAGFGGSVWALTSASDAEAFSRTWRDAYARDFPVAAASSEFFVTRAGPGAVKL
ncbi:MAG TPA: galactokinase family protein [Gemmatimonadaceae bacterium]